MDHQPPCRSQAMHVPRELYPMERTLAERLPHLRGPQRRGLALWVLGTVLAQSACQSAVLAALLPWAPYHALRQRLREWLLDGVGKAAPCATQVEAEACFAPLLRLLRLLRPAVPPGWTVLVLADRGLWSPRLWRRVRCLGWHPLLRIQRRTTVTPHRREPPPA